VLVWGLAPSLTGTQPAREPSALALVKNRLCRESFWQQKDYHRALQNGRGQSYNEKIGMAGRYEEGEARTRQKRESNRKSKRRMKDSLGHDQAPGTPALEGSGKLRGCHNQRQKKGRRLKKDVQTAFRRLEVPVDSCDLGVSHWRPCSGYNSSDDDQRSRIPPQGSSAGHSIVKNRG